MEAIKEATKLVFKLDKSTINTINKQIVKDLQDPKWGFKLQHAWHTDDGHVNDGKFSVYSPLYNRSETKRSDIWERAFGCFDIFNDVKYTEHAGKDNPFTGDQTYEPFDGGLYRLCLGVWELPKGDMGYGGADEVALPSAKYALIPMLQHGHKPDEPRMFGRAYGDKVPLSNLHSMIARANFSSVHFCPHNPGRLENLDKFYSGMTWAGGKHTDATDYNWLMVYNSTYSMYRSTLGGAFGFSDVKVTAGNRDDVIKDAMNLHRVFD